MTSAIMRPMSLSLAGEDLFLFTHLSSYPLDGEASVNFYLYASVFLLFVYLSLAVVPPRHSPSLPLRQPTARGRSESGKERDGWAAARARAQRPGEQMRALTVCTYRFCLSPSVFEPSRMPSQRATYASWQAARASSTGGPAGDAPARGTLSTARARASVCRSSPVCSSRTAVSMPSSACSAYPLRRPR